MNHLEKLAAKLPEFGLDAMMITSDPGEFYAIGFHGEGVVMVTPQKSYYFTDSRYIEAAGKRVTGAEITMTDGSNNALALVQKTIQDCGIRKLGFEDGYMTVAAHAGYTKSLPCTLIPAQQLVGDLRAAKDGEEIAVMEQAQRISERALEEILKFIKPGVTEKEVAAKLTYDMLRFGAERMSFDPIVASGPNGSLPHAIPGDKAICAGEFVTMDFGCVCGGYCSDMTRTVAVGEPTEEMKKVYATVLKAQLTGIAASRAGVTGKSIHQAAAKVIEDAGYGAYFGHGFGHSVGIEIHESPNANGRDETRMPVGAAVSAEPGIYLPGKFGVRIEDVVIMEENGCRDLTHAPKELIIL